MQAAADQQAGKSTVCRVLAGDKWFSDGMPDVHQDHVRLSQHLRGRWLIEIGELAAMNKAESEDLKSFLSRTHERFTPKYGRREVIEARQCVFVGTTNSASYLRDETGGRRFWPVAVETIDLEAFKHDRDQLFAEATRLYRTGARWWPTPELEARLFRSEQAERAEEDPWQEPLSAWLKDANRKSPVTIMSAAIGPLGLPPGSVTRLHQLRIRHVLAQLGWEARRSNGVRTWWPRHDAAVQPAAVNAPSAGARRAKLGEVVPLAGTRRR